MEKYGLKENDLVTLKCGASSAQARISRIPVNPMDSREMGLSADILHHLRIPEETTFLIKPEANRCFRLGPVIGILTFPGHIPHALKFYRTYAEVNKTNGILFVFRGRGIDLERRIVSGYYYNHREKTWQPGEFPYPDAVIDRTYPNAYISHILLEKVIGKNRIFNKRSMINKLDFVKALGKNPVLGKHIPETWGFSDASQMESMLEKYGEVFLKPVDAMKGIGIVVVKKSPGGVMSCSYFIKGKNFTTHISSANEIFEVLVKAAGYRRPYVIQQGIPRMEYQGGPFSIRTWAMKNGQGRWVIPGMFAKGSLGSGFLTNFTAGAKLIKLKDLFESIIPRLPYAKTELLTLLEDLTLKTAEGLDARFGPLGELGLDIVFDHHGKPWLIEANGNPGIIPIFIQKEYPLWPALLYKYPSDYATFLAGFR